MRYAFTSRVARAFHHEPITRADRDGTVHRSDQGWFMLLEGSHEALHIGMEQPEKDMAGKTARVTVEVLP